ncbi:MAG: hypothetical protein JOY82_06235 [Streptosporangiaceae bacterium]|nr:hypothetical protein [Streptosporangiaceae bacterium]MBV9854109.1 hypothetical protein [Streptosporangiaceae bacterium]
MCTHTPPCPDARATDRCVARVVASHPEQGWSLLCNGVVLFDDAGVLVLERAPFSGGPPPRAAGRGLVPVTGAAA